jgi:type IV secretory pathway VirB10-like protein
MGKLRPPSKAEVSKANAIPAPPVQAQVSEEQPVDVTAEASASQDSTPAQTESTPFQVQSLDGEQSAPAADGTPEKKSLQKRRQDKINVAIARGPFEYKEKRDGDFTCICGARGKSANVLIDRSGQEILVGNGCMKYTNVSVPKQAKAPRTPGSPSISREQKFQDALNKFQAPYSYAREQQGEFTCLCGGKGSNQIVVADANGAEFSVGAKCASVIPGVQIPRPERRAPAGTLAGLKGQAAPPPTFENVG